MLAHGLPLAHAAINAPSAAALFNGVTLTLVKQAPTMAITFAAYEVRRGCRAP